jgi:acetyl esterase/lipase
MEVLLGHNIDDESAQAEVSLEILAARTRSTSGDNNGTGSRAAPPFFIWATADDMVVPPANSLLLASALLAARVPVEIHLFERGGAHGLGMGREDDQNMVLAKDRNAAVSPAAAKWSKLLVSWITAQSEEWAGGGTKPARWLG